jgi:hypothetical protein
MTVNDGNPTYIYSDKELLTFNETKKLATKQEYETADRCIGSIFEVLKEGENIKLDDGYFILNQDLDLIQDWQII